MNKLALLNPLGSIFGRIFLWFWFTLVLLAGASYFLVDQLSQPYSLYDLDDNAQTLVNDFQKRSKRFLNAQSPKKPIKVPRDQREKVILITDSGNIFDNPQIKRDRRLRFMFHDMMNNGELKQGTVGKQTWIGPIKLTVHDKKITAFLRGKHKKAGLLSHTTLIANIVIGLLISGGLSALLALSFIRPIRSLIKATLKLTKGKWSTRVADNVATRKDELGILGRNFNAMASHNESLINAQQQLLSNVSHELRSPLTRLQVALGIARQKDNIQDVQQNLDRIENETGRLEGLIAQALKLSRLENAMQHMQKQPCDLNEILTAVINDAQFENPNINFVKDFETLPILNGDTQMLHSAFENIIRNALRFSPEDKPVEVTAKPIKGDVFIQIRDHGPGVPDGDIEHLFEPFYRVNKDNGIGLGLSIANQAVKAHNGFIEANNCQDGGLSVVIRINM